MDLIMTNIFDDDTLNISEYKPDSRGVECAKKMFLLTRLCVIFVVVGAVITYYLFSINNIFELYLVRNALVYVGLLWGVFGGEIIWFIRILSMRNSFKFTEQEKFDFNYYCLYKKKNSGVWVTNNYLLALAVNSALMGSKERCKEALVLISEDYEPEVLGILRAWVKSEKIDIDRNLVSPQKKLGSPLRIIPLFFMLDFGLLTACVDYRNLVDLGFSKQAIGILGFFQCVAFVLLCTFIALMIILYTVKNKTFTKTFKLKKAIKVALGIVIMVFTTYAVFTNEALNYGIGAHQDAVKDETDYSEDDSADEDDMADYYLDDSEKYADVENEYKEAYDDEMNSDELEIMNKMIILCNYLQKNGVIDDFSVVLGYNAKGRVKGTVAQDEKYVYVLYDNGNKQDKGGNNCIELVLEAEPLDENGISLGQTEAVLKGFYLVDLETGEVTDEHKNHW